MFTNLAIVWGPHFAEMGGRRNTPWFGEVCGIGFRTLGGSPTKVPLRKKLWKSKLSDPFLWQNHGIREKPLEIPRKNLWKSNYHGKPMGKPWENHGKLKILLFGREISDIGSFWSILLEIWCRCALPIWRQGSEACKVDGPIVMWTLVYKAHEYYRYNPHKQSTLVKLDLFAPT